MLSQPLPNSASLPLDTSTTSLMGLSAYKYHHFGQLSIAPEKTVHPGDFEHQPSHPVVSSISQVARLNGAKVGGKDDLCFGTQ